MSLDDFGTLVAATITPIAVFIAAFQLHQANIQRRRAFEDLFVQRYWAIMDKLSVAAIECDPPKNREVSPGDRHAVILYLRLCEDELDLRAQRWVSPDTWRIWHAGISVQLKRWPFDEVWKEVSEREESKGKNGQFMQLRKAEDGIYRTGFDVASRRRSPAEFFKGR